MSLDMPLNQEYFEVPSKKGGCFFPSLFLIISIAIVVFLVIRILSDLFN